MIGEGIHQEALRVLVQENTLENIGPPSVPPRRPIQLIPVVKKARLMLPVPSS